MADEERDVCHVLRIVAAHHLGEDQIGRGGAEEPQPARRRMGDGNEVSFPIAAEEDLVGSEEMSDVETFRAQFIVRLFLRFPEGFIGSQLIQICKGYDRVHVFDAATSGGGSENPSWSAARP